MELKHGKKSCLELLETTPGRRVYKYISVILKRRTTPVYQKSDDGHHCYDT